MTQSLSEKTTDKANTPPGPGLPPKGGKTSAFQPIVLLNERLVALQFASGAKTLPPHVRERLLDSVTSTVTANRQKLADKLETSKTALTKRKHELRAEFKQKIRKLDQDAQSRHEKLEQDANQSLVAAIEEAIDLVAIGKALATPAPPPADSPNPNSGPGAAPAGDANHPRGTP